MMSEADELEHSEIPNITALLSKYHLHIVNNYPAKSHRILSDTLIAKEAIGRVAKSRRYSPRLSRIIVLLFNKLVTNIVISSKVFESFPQHFSQVPLLRLCIS